MTAATDLSPLAEAQEFEHRMLSELRSSIRRRRVQAVVIGVGVVGAGFVVWWLLVAALKWINPETLPDPVGVVTTLFDLLRTASLWVNVWATLSAALIGLALGTVIGVLIGVALSRARVVRQALSPLIVFFNAMPRPALAPIFIVWFGLGLWAKVAASISIVSFIMLLSALAGLSSINPDHVQLCRSLTVRGWQYFWKVEMPSALPSLYSGLRLSASGTILGVFVAEVVAAYNGVGQLFIQANNTFQMTTVFALVIVISLIAVVLDGAAWLAQRLLGGRRGL
jgi:NitT/TauT family transport system permease protein